MEQLQTCQENLPLLDNKIFSPNPFTNGKLPSAARKNIKKQQMTHSWSVYQ
jgi:hypothetical protein